MNSTTAPSKMADLIAERLQVQVGKTLAGGSGAATALARDNAGRTVVVKAVASRPGVVDGHDLAAFRAKQDQIELLIAKVPRIGRRYPAVLGRIDEDDWSAVVYEYLPGRPAAELLQDSPHIGARALLMAWTQLMRDGYRHILTSAAPIFWTNIHLARVARRRHLLAKHLPPTLLTDPTLRINGARVPGLDALLTRATAAAPLFTTTQLAVPVHGDLNVRNILLADPAGNKFGLVDPRGTRQGWDPLYDLGKILFSLSAFETCMGGGLTASAGARGSTWMVAVEDNPWSTALYQFLADLPQYKHSFASSGLDTTNWLPRLLFTHACHMIAEAPCRLSDASDPPALRRRKALGLLLLGMRLLSDLLDTVDSGQAISTRHLHLLGEAALA